MSSYGKFSPGRCRDDNGCLCPFCGCGTYEVLDLSMFGTGGNQILAPGLTFSNPDEDWWHFNCQWTGTTSTVSLALCGTPPSSFFVVFRFLYSGINYDGCHAEIELWDSSAKNTLYAWLSTQGAFPDPADGVRCCRLFTGKAFQTIYNILDCDVPSTITLAGDVADLNECEETENCCGPGTPPCTGSSEETPDINPLGCPTNCCDSNKDTLTLDFGAGGLTADDCEGSGCGDISGNFDLDWLGVAGSSSGEHYCLWGYQTVAWCDSTCGMASGFCADTYTLTIYGHIVPDTCEVEVEVTLGIILCAAGHPDCTDTVARAIYRSSTTLGPDEECGTGGAVTLNKISEDWADACGGSLPATITATFN